MTIKSMIVLAILLLLVYLAIFVLAVAITRIALRWNWWVDDRPKKKRERKKK